MRTRVGYAGGTKDDPTYHAMGDHTEVVQVEYNPEVTSYKKLLEEFWSNHDPTSQAWKRQYWNAVFYQNDRQKKHAESSLEEIQKDVNGSIETRVLPIRSFTRAEQYHQKYYLQQNRDLMQKLMKPYPDATSFLDSTVATRANAFVAKEINEKELRMRLDDAPFATISPEMLEQSEAILCGKQK